MRTLLFKNLMRGPVTEAAPLPDEAALAELAGKVDSAAKRRLGRSLAIREVDAGSCNACELEIHALNNAFYDLERFGLRFVASPRHADVLMVTGPVTKNMREALERTYNATPGPKWVVAVGNCAADGGIFAGSYAVVGGVDKVIPVDLHIKGCPPTPTQLLEGLLALLDQPPSKPGRPIAESQKAARLAAPGSALRANQFLRRFNSRPRDFSQIEFIYLLVAGAPQSKRQSALLGIVVSTRPFQSR